MFFRLLAVVPFLLSFPVIAAPPAWLLQIGLGNEDTGTVDDNFTQLTGAFRYGKGLTRKSSYNLNADIYTRRFDTASSRDKDGLLLEAAYNVIPVPGYTKPVYSFVLRQEFERFDNQANDTSQTSLLVIDSFRIDEQWNFVGGLELIRLTSDLIESDIVGLFAGLDFWATDDLVLYGKIKVQAEDNALKLNASPRPANRIEFAGSHLPSEPGFTGDTGGSTPTSGSSTDSDNLFLTLGFNYSFDEHQSIDLSYERFRYDTISTITLKRISLDYFLRF